MDHKYLRTLLKDLDPKLPGTACVVSGAGINVKIHYDPPLRDSGYSTFTTNISGKNVVVYMYPVTLDGLDSLAGSMLFSGEVPDAFVWGLSFFCSVDGVQYTDPDVMEAVARALSKSGNLDVEMLLGGFGGS